ncbi:MULTISPECIES: G/U mismatch-specific DNA glycosylase [unclassified Mycobacterium]|uniref:G/U mismatch-specific DNA glycosylase n=1 Tax=unclassified Mycobacterium TaxID=2642494 RepID=UPI00099203D3|nr:MULTISPECIES: G/U mismatch-specific DNA glycosylase [unclassified Mycobacterium]
MGQYSPDILASGLDVVFCGINPASTAVADGHNFSNRSNRFWEVLYRAGFTDIRLRPEDERQLLTYGCGITAAVSRATPRADDVTASEFRAARPDFEEKMRCLEPRALAFLGKRAVVSMLEAPHIAFGLQPFRFAEVTTWVLPNPSGLNRRFTLDVLVDAYAELRMSLTDGSSTGRRPGPGHR